MGQPAFWGFSNMDEMFPEQHTNHEGAGNTSLFTVCGSLSLLNLYLWYVLLVFHLQIIHFVHANNIVNNLNVQCIANKTYSVKKLFKLVADRRQKKPLIIFAVNSQAFKIHKFMKGSTILF